MFSSTQRETLERFVDLFLRENAKANLTGCEDREVFWRKHIVDSAMLDQYVNFKPGQRVADVGSGGGLPGIVLAQLHPETHFVLIDSHRKKTDACERMKRELELGNVTIRCVRVEDFGRDPEFRETFDWALSRAVAKLPVLLEYCLPLITPGGWFVSYKGPDPSDEIAAAKWPLKALGGRMDAAREFTLPDGDDRRTFVFVEKIAKTTSVFPRRNGLPRKRPISEDDARRAIEERMEKAYSARTGDQNPGGKRPRKPGKNGFSRKTASRGGPPRETTGGQRRGQGNPRDGGGGGGSSRPHGQGQGNGSRGHRRDTRGGPRRGSGGPAGVS